MWSLIGDCVRSRSGTVTASWTACGLKILLFFRWSAEMIMAINFPLNQLMQDLQNEILTQSFLSRNCGSWTASTPEVLKLAACSAWSKMWLFGLLGNTSVFRKKLKEVLWAWRLVLASHNLLQQTESATVFSPCAHARLDNDKGRKVKGEVRTINDRNICERRSCMKNNGKSPTFKFVSGEERRPSEVQRISRDWRLPGATHSSADLTWIRKWLKIQAPEPSELESVGPELGSCCSDFDKLVSDEICRTRKRHFEIPFRL